MMSTTRALVSFFLIYLLNRADKQLELCCNPQLSVIESSDLDPETVPDLEKIRKKRTAIANVSFFTRSPLTPSPGKSAILREEDLKD